MLVVHDCCVRLKLMATAWLQQAALGQVKAVKRTRYGRGLLVHIYRLDILQVMVSPPAKTHQAPPKPLGSACKDCQTMLAGDPSQIGWHTINL